MRLLGAWLRPAPLREIVAAPGLRPLLACVQLDVGLGEQGARLPAVFGGAGNDVFTYDDSDFGGSTGVMASHSDSLFDFAAGDRFDLTGLISTADLARAGDVNGAIRIVGGDGSFVIEINEGAVLHNSPSADWSAAFNVYGQLDDLSATIGTGPDSATYRYDTGTGHFELGGG